MSLSLVAVFIPILLMGGIVGRLFREFAVTLTIAIMISMVVSLTTTPMMCAFVLRPPRKDAEKKKENWLARRSEQIFASVQDFYGRTLGWVLRHPGPTALVFLGTVVLNIFLYIEVPRGSSRSRTPAASSPASAPIRAFPSQSMRRKFREFVSIVRSDPAIENVVGFTGGFQVNSGFLFATLKPLSERDVSADQVIARLRTRVSQVAGANLFMQAVQDIRVGGRKATRSSSSPCSPIRWPTFMNGHPSWCRRCSATRR